MFVPFLYELYYINIQLIKLETTIHLIWKPKWTTCSLFPTHAWLIWAIHTNQVLWSHKMDTQFSSQFLDSDVGLPSTATWSKWNPELLLFYFPNSHDIHGSMSDICIVCIHPIFYQLLQCAPASQITRVYSFFFHLTPVWPQLSVLTDTFIQRVFSFLLCLKAVCRVSELQYSVNQSGTYIHTYIAL